MSVRIFTLALFTLAIAPVRANDLHFEGYVDLRLVSPSNDQSWSEGGLGKLRLDASDSDLRARIGEAVVEGKWQIDSDVLAVASLRYEEDQRTPIDVLEAYVRYRPVSTSSWRWSVKAGAFFPPISLENDEIGWTSYWTLTPSAINTWVGEELRTIGAEAKIELRGTTDTFEAVAAIYALNDPAGVLIADRGWAMGDVPTGLFDHVRLPDAFSVQIGGPLPLDSPMFKEIDDRAGWYASVKWMRPDLGSLQVLYYDNEGDASYIRDNVIAWRTEFVSLGAQTKIGNLTLLAQALAGETEAKPYWGYDSVTRYWSAYVLAGWECDVWRFAARADIFASDQREHYFDWGSFDWVNEDGENGEHGNAFTFAATWAGEDWLRLTTELIYLYSFRRQREVVGELASSDQLQIQQSVRIYF